jgi:alcohol dehydrogenase class IV
MSSNIIEDIITYSLDEALINNYYTFRVPPTTIVGDGSIVKSGKLIQQQNAKKVFIVTDKQIVNINLLAPLLRSLERNKIPYYIFDEVLPDPTDSVVITGVKMLQKQNCDVVIGFGGGSPIDAAKVIAILATNNIKINEIKNDSSLNRRLPLIAVPTTAGTGTEVTSVAVITNSQTHIKSIVDHTQVIPDIAIIDPKLTLGIPPKITSATGIDVLTHAIEAYVAKNSCTLARALAQRSIRLVRKYLPTAVGYGENIRARHKMAIASYMAGMAFSNSGLGLCHAMAHQIGGKYKIPHGIANALFLPHIMRFNLLVRVERFVDIAIAMGEKIESLSQKDAGLKAISAVKNLIQDIGLPTRLREVGVERADFRIMAENALKDATIHSNPRISNIDSVIEIFEKAY